MAVGATVDSPSILRKKLADPLVIMPARAAAHNPVALSQYAESDHLGPAITG